MYCKLAFTTLAVIIGSEFVSAQHIPPTTTAAELWNPWTWFWPYAKASAEAYRDYYDKAQKATNELYQQIYKTNAFPWITGNWSTPQSNQGGNNQTGNGTQPNQEGNKEQSNQENSTQQNQEDSDNQENTTTASEKGDDQAGEENEENQTTDKTSGAQVQGSVQDDGTADAEVNAKVQEKK